ncbi:MAG: cyanophycinase [Acidobacteria bacterium]|nr:cyanophycinase [Acidobacteriota bacterium]
MDSLRLSLGAGAAFALVAVTALAQPASGPARGSLLAAGGGALGPAIVKRFIDLAGGPGALIVVIPTAGELDTSLRARLEPGLLVKAGARRIRVLHTRDRMVADTEAFAAPLREARGVWFEGGRQWRLVDSYAGTRTQREIQNVLARGGVVGGTSAGASILASYMVRGARDGNHILMAPGYEEGFGFLRNAAIDQHLFRRGRERDMIQVVAAYPDLLGIGIDESTAIVVSGNTFEVIGAGKVAIYSSGQPASPGYQLLDPGVRFDLTQRKRIP